MSRFATVAAVTAAVLSLAACGSDPDDWGGIKVDFATADATPDWSPDGKQIAFASNRDGGGIFVVRPDGKGIRRVTATQGKAPEWSPDGKEIAFEAPDGLRVVAVTGKGEHRVARVSSTGEQSMAPAWSPDGKRIAFVREVSDGSYVIFVVPSNGGVSRRLLKPAFDPEDPGWSILIASELTPAWSADGKRIAYNNSEGVVYFATVATGKRETVTTDGAGYDPTWSPDGSKLAYQCAGSLCLADLATGTFTTLLGDAGAPSWSPDGKQIAVERYLYGNANATASPMALYVVRADESGADVLTFGPGEFEPDE